MTSVHNRFEIPGVVHFEHGQNDLTRAVITTPQAEARLYLLGAHVTHYQLTGAQPLLFLSGRNAFERGQPIRGGVPIIFPWFGPRQDDSFAPAHGFARVLEWNIEAVEQVADSAVTLTLSLQSNAMTRAAWPSEFTLTYRVTVGAALALELEVRNAGDETLCFEEALHTYFAVSDVRNVAVEGLEDTRYIDKPDGFRCKEQGMKPVRITGETDRIYLDTRATCVLNDPGAGRRILVEKSGSDSTVIWNPWIAKAQAMSDFGNNEWPNMICIETCNVADHAVTLAPGQSHSMRAIIRSEPR
jgi:glucose-6-phosphate 1-epimerase